MMFKYDCILKTYQGDELVPVKGDSLKEASSKIERHKRRLFKRGIKNAEFKLLL